MSASGVGNGPLDPVVARGRILLGDSLDDIRPGESVLLGVSGGADSLALAILAAYVAPRAGIHAHALVVDHGLQVGSDLVAERAAETVREIGMPAEVMRVEVGSDGGPEAAARAARRTALATFGVDHDDIVILLGHTRDDQAETVLLGLARGSGARSLAGIASHFGPWRRPLLSLTRADTERICRLAGVAWWDDPHNEDRRYARVRARRDVLPVLEDALGPGIADALARTAALLRDDADLLETLAADAYDDVLREPGALDCRGLMRMARALRTRVLRAAAIDAGTIANDLTAAHIQAVDRLVTRWRGQGGPALPGGVTVDRVKSEGRNDVLVYRRVDALG